MTPPTVIIGESYVQNAKALLERNVIGVMPGEFQKTRDTTRQTYNFGYNYALLKKHDRTWTNMPKVLVDLCAESLKQLRIITHAPLPNAKEFTNCIISVYEPGFQLQPHVDVDEGKSAQAKLGFYFGDCIVGVVIKADVAGGLYIVDKERAVHPVPENDGSAYLLSGPLRNSYHGISTIAKKRISATFRTVHFK